MPDVQTLQAVCAGLELVVAVALFLAWRINPDARSLLWWAVANVVASAGMLLMLVRGAGPTATLVFASVIPFVLAHLLILHGIRRHTGRGGFHWASLALALFCVAGLYHFSFNEPHPMGRIVSLHSFVATISLLAGIALFEEGRRNGFAGTRVVGLVFIANGVFFIFTALLPLLDGRQAILPEAAHGAITFFEAALFSAASGIGYLVMATERLQQTFRHDARHDALTGALNRAAFLETAHRAFEGSRRNDQPSACLVMDIDHFKLVNRRHGRAAGDEILKTLSRLTRQHMRAGDLIGRYGGDEFCVLLSGVDGAGAAALAERLREAFSQPLLSLRGEPMRVTVSIGIGDFPADCNSLSDLISVAESGLDQAKNSGRNRVEPVHDLRFEQRPGLLAVAS